MNDPEFEFNNMTTSYACGKRIAFDLCKNGPGTDCSGSKGNHGAGPSKSSLVGQDNTMTTFKAQCQDPDSLSAVIFR
jgi:hypothetical protein